MKLPKKRNVKIYGIAPEKFILKTLCESIYAAELVSSEIKFILFLATKIESGNTTPPLTQEEICAGIGCVRSTFFKNVQKLKNNGWIEFNENENPRTYRLFCSPRQRT